MSSLVSVGLRQAVDSMGRTPLHVAAAGGLPDCCRLLIEMRASVDDRDVVMHRTPLHWAAERGHKHCAEEILKELTIHTTLALSTADSHQNTPLHLSVCCAI